jgi:hypothetical protein
MYGFKNGLHSRITATHLHLDLNLNSIHWLPMNKCVCVDAFLERQTLNKNRWRCSLVRRGRSAARGRTVRDLVQEHGFPA